MPRDRALVFVDGVLQAQQLGNCHECVNEPQNDVWLAHCPWPSHNGSAIAIEVEAAGAHTLDILVENAGRPAPDLLDMRAAWRGLHSSFVRVGGADVTPWRMRPFPLKMTTFPRAARNAMPWAPLRDRHAGAAAGAAAGPPV